MMIDNDKGKNKYILKLEEELVNTLHAPLRIDLLLGYNYKPTGYFIKDMGLVEVINEDNDS
jgi:hypothetical protein